MAKTKKSNGFVQFFVFAVMSFLAFALQIAIVMFGDNLLRRAGIGVTNADKFTAFIFGDYTVSVFIAFLVGNIVAKIISYILNRNKTFAATNNLAFSFSIYIVMCICLIIAETLLGEPLTNALINKLPDSFWTFLNTTAEKEAVDPCFASGISVIIYSIADFFIVFLLEKFVIMNNNLFASKNKQEDDDEDDEDEDIEEKSEVEETTEDVEEPEDVEIIEDEDIIEDNGAKEEEAKMENKVVTETNQEPIKVSNLSIPRDSDSMNRIAEQLEEQVKVNTSINERLDRLDQNVQLILDILKGLATDSVAAGVSSIAVPLEDVESHMVAEADAFEQEELKEEDTSAIEELETEKEDSWIDNADTNVRIKPKLSFEMRLRVANDDIKKFYSDIKNELLSYGIHSRISRHRENFNQGRMNICRLVINGKTLKVYLAVDPTSIDARYYHQEDVSFRKGLVDLPTMINVRSKVAARKVKELIAIIMESLVINKKNYEPYDFTKDLTMEGLTTIQCKGYDYLCKDEVTQDDVNKYPDTFASDLVEVVEDSDYQERYIKTKVTLDDLTKNFNDGDIVDIDAIRDKDLGPVNSNFLSVSESEKLNKKLKVYAHELTPNAVKMICLAGGEVFVVVQPEKAE